MAQFGNGQQLRCILLFFLVLPPSTPSKPPTQHPPSSTSSSQARKNQRPHLSSNGDLNLNTGLDVDDNLLDNLGGGVQVDEALVDAHLIGIPGLGTLTAGRLAGCDLEVLGGQADRALDAELLGLGAVDELLADLCGRGC